MKNTDKKVYGVYAIQITAEYLFFNVRNFFFFRFGGVGRTKRRYVCLG